MPSLTTHRDRLQNRYARWRPRSQMVLTQAARGLIRGHAGASPGADEEADDGGRVAALLCFDEMQITDVFTAVALKGACPALPASARGPAVFCGMGSGVCSLLKRYCDEQLVLWSANGQQRMTSVADIYLLTSLTRFPPSISKRPCTCCAGVMEELIAEGAVIVTTSNRPPWELQDHGLHEVRPCTLTGAILSLQQAARFGISTAKGRGRVDSDCTEQYGIV